MSRLLDWFQKKAETRLRLSQIKILYQNQAAITYLLQELEAAREMGIGGTHISLLRDFDGIVSDHIIELTYLAALSQQASDEILSINTALKMMYSDLSEGKRLARSRFGAPAGDLVDFATRFMPANGWDGISDREWDRMVSEAMNRE